MYETYSGIEPANFPQKGAIFTRLDSVGVEGPYLLRMIDNLLPQNASPEGHGS